MNSEQDIEKIFNFIKGCWNITKISKASKLSSNYQ